MDALVLKANQPRSPHSYFGYRVLSEEVAGRSAAIMGSRQPNDDTVGSLSAAPLKAAYLDIAQGGLLPSNAGAS